MQYLAAILVWSIGLTVSAADEQPWGHLSGRFVYDGDPPARRAFDVTKDAEIRKNAPLLNESLIVDAKSRGLANVFIWLRASREDAELKIHPDYEKYAQDQVVMEIERLQYTPHAIALRTSQKLLVRSKDPILHAPRDGPTHDQGRGQTFPTGAATELAYRYQESKPISLDCNVHPWESAVVLVRDNPYFALTGADGKFEIKNLPVGEWTFQVWQERAHDITQVKRGGAIEKWEKGRLKVTIKPGDNPLGDLLLAPDAFK